jgi:glycerol-3-phosphate dehydrogenase
MEFLAPCFSLPELWYYGCGLKLYDRIAGRDRLAPSRILGAKEAAGLLARLRLDRLRGAVSYADGQFDDARYALALVTTFVEAGGRALNYAHVAGFDRAPGGRIAAAAVEDRISGAPFPLRARAFVNATGPFSDRLRRLAAPTAPPRLRLSKGVHVLFPLDNWGSGALLVPKTEDGRVVFAIPYQGRLLVGTTEEPASPDADMLVTRPEIDYLIRQINPYLNRPLAAAEMVSGFAGLRPLVGSRDAGDTSRLIRDDDVEVDSASGLVSILGGKWTTYRLMAERTIDRVQALLGIPVTGCVTAHTPLAGANPLTDGQVRALTECFGLDTARRLARRFGSRAEAVARLAGESPDLRLPLIAGAPPLRAEVVYAARHEMARTVEDVLARRTGLEYYGWRLAMEAAPEAAGLLARELRWPPDQTARAAAGYTRKITRLLESAGQ